MVILYICNFDAKKAIKWLIVFWCCAIVNAIDIIRVLNVFLERVFLDSAEFADYAPRALILGISL